MLRSEKLGEILGKARPAAIGYMRIQPPARMLTMPINSFQPQAVWSMNMLTRARTPEITQYRPKSATKTW